MILFREFDSIGKNIGNIEHIKLWISFIKDQVAIIVSKPKKILGHLVSARKLHSKVRLRFAWLSEFLIRNAFPVWHGDTAWERLFHIEIRWVVYLKHERIIIIFLFYFCRCNLKLRGFRSRFYLFFDKNESSWKYSYPDVDSETCSYDASIMEEKNKNKTSIRMLRWV